MDQEQAQVLFREGAMLVFLDVPQGTEFGIDCQSWRVGPKFKGVKMIPPGVHFVYFSACSKEGEVSPRTGFFYHFKKREVLIKKWDKVTEDMKTTEVTKEEQDRVESNRKELDQYLGAYPYDSYKKWVSLSNHITESLASRLQPQSGKITAVTQLVSEGSTTQSRRERADREMETAPSGTRQDKEVESRLPELTVEPGSRINFSAIPKQKYPEGATPAQVTQYSMDSSHVLKVILDTHYSDNPMGLLGELQFAFICFLIGQNYDGFEQWKKLVHVLCTSDEALALHPNLFGGLIRVLYFQVGEIPEDFFVDIVSSNNFLTATLQIFFSNLEGTDPGSDLRKRGLKFREHLTKKFKWDFMSEPDDEAPVIVE
ncbi:protein AAR2 homolog [Lingula anatina]|uniref:Protein AAR2 homolog n=1 Tax=Lingula anatina TaxID=7574 RepID=A0A1S3JYJ5_LINAN|nr:protein AAR2 homolog [Lingula anatina]|eukprot:XP_013415495.2 protein AAR2 homolog [Lingula anatina]